jgi:hypothetical protein
MDRYAGAHFITGVRGQQRGCPLRAERRHTDHDRLLGVIEFVTAGSTDYYCSATTLLHPGL